MADSKPRKRAWILGSLITIALGGATFLPVCNLCFGCGCVTLWSGAAAHCDIHMAGPPDCPWCHHPWMGYVAMGMASLAGVGSVLLRRSARLSSMTLFGVVGFHVALFAIGAVTALAMGTPVFAGMR